ncbi:hypothetical protein M1O14_01685 [Dehalococcoidia bacterium]|nr:hypothetical protein [Dehalococcoidia bacterium]
MAEAIREILRFLGSHILEITGLVISAIVAFGVFWGPKLAEKRRERREKLKRHYDELVHRVLMPMDSEISKVIVREGSFLCGNVSLAVSFPQTFEFEQGEFFRSFGLHFPRIARRWRQFKAEITDHNNKIETFVEEIKSSMATFGGSVGLHLAAFRTNAAVITDKMPMYLYGELYSPTGYFRQAKIEACGNFFVVMSSGGATSFATVNTYQQAQELLNKFIEITEAPQNKQKASEITEKEKQLEREREGIKGELEEISSLRGIQDLKEAKECRFCREIC